MVVFGFDCETLRGKLLSAKNRFAAVNGRSPEERKPRVRSGKASFDQKPLRVLDGGSQRKKQEMERTRREDPVVLPIVLFRYSTGFADTIRDIRAESTVPNEIILYHAHPTMFRDSPIRFLIWVALAPLGIGLIVLLFWWLKVLGTTLTVTNERIVLRKGVLAKHTNEVYHSDVRNVRVSQSVLQRIFGVGAIGVASAGSASLEIMVGGIPAPQKVKGIIDQERRQSR